MANQLPFRTTTASGETIDITFPLHPETISPMRVSQMLTAVLEAIDREVKLTADTSNGDVMQAVAMALAIRAAMVEAPKQTTDHLSHHLVATALAALGDADRRYGQVGHA